MVKSGIKIFARIRPTKKQTGLYEVGETDDGAPTITIHVPRSEASGYINNKKENYSFRFNQVFDKSTKQEEIFENVAHGVIDNCLEGYNGTIFAYGQTGSGKTFTITGGAERYADRGIIPRTLSYLFQEYQRSPGTIYSTHISYLEVYNNSGYDLLDPKHEAAKLEDLPKIQMMEDSDGNIHLKNLSLHPAANEEEALNWLFLGDTNRMIAETPMNMASTRSHCIFTIHISSREAGSDTIKKAKLHLVDLAGSERVSKSGVGGTLLAEAKYINVSLHCLEQVIVALSEKNRSHVPYRNSMMTLMLRDSLGGNCMTTMIATCSVEKKYMDETISTCRFAQRVALVKNEAILNEELDPKLMVARLKQQVQDLKDELSMATGEERTDELTDEEKAECKELVKGYVEDVNPEARLPVGSDMRKIQLCFQLLKAEIVKRSQVEEEKPSSIPSPTSKEESLQPNTSDTNQQQSSLVSPQPGLDEPGPTTVVSKKKERVISDGELQELRELLRQRDDEINVLLKILKQERRRANEAESALKEAGLSVERKRPPSPILGRTSPLRVDGPVPESMISMVSSTNGASSRNTVGSAVSLPSSQSRSSSAVSTSERRRHSSGAATTATVAASTTAGSGSRTTSSGVGESRSSQDWSAMKAELSQARQDAFDLFRKNYADTTTIGEHKKMLKIKYSEAKALGERVNSSRMKINKLKAKIEQHRVSQGIQGLTDGTQPSGPDAKEEEMKKEIETEKANFKTLYGQLRELKTEIEHIQHLLEKAKVKLQKDFEQWWNQQSSNTKDPSSTTKSAWYTPPTSGSPYRLQPHPPPRPPSSSSSSLSGSASSSLHSSRNHSRSRHRSSRASHRTMAAQFTQPGPGQQSGDKPTTDSVTSSFMTSSLNGIGSAESKSWLSTAGGRSGDVSASSGVGSSLSSSDYLYQSGTGGGGGVVLDHSSSATTRNSTRIARRQPDSLPRVGGTVSDGKALLNTQSSDRIITSTALSHPKPLFDAETSSLDRSHSSIPLTGDSRADADIIAFYRARQKLIQKEQSPR